MTDEQAAKREDVSLTIRVYVPVIDADMVSAVRHLVIDVLVPYPDAKVDVTMQEPRQPRLRRI